MACDAAETLIETWVSAGMKRGTDVLLACQSKPECHFRQIFDGHCAVVLGSRERQIYRQDGGGRTTERKEQPIAWKTLLEASSGWSMTLGRGKSAGGSWGWGGLWGGDKGTGLILRGAGGVDWRRRALGLRTELLRMRVPYECECEEGQSISAGHCWVQKGDRENIKRLYHVIRSPLSPAFSGQLP